MKRRVISLLAILAMLCTMVVFAMPAIAGEAETYPCYKDHAAQTAAGYDGKNWSITTAEDWKAIIATANSTSDTEYFKGVTFHLTNDVNFSQTEWLAPMGEGKYFSGTINGHGYGFNDLKIYEGSASVGDATSDNESATGMFHRLGNCTFIDFGVNSGTVVRAAGGTKNAATTFGGLKNGYKPTFTRVWSGMTLHQTAGGTVCGLAAPIDEVYTDTITVNGFVYDGKKLSTANRPGYSMVGFLSSARAIESSFVFTNVISDAQLYNYVSGNKHPALSGSYSLAAGATYDAVQKISTEYYGAIFGAYDNTQMKTSKFENFYGVSYPNMETFLGREAKVRTLDQRRVANSAVEAAWTINNNPSKTADPVYFTFKNGKVRPVAEDTNKIVKVTLTGIKNEEYFFNANTTLDLEDDLKKNDQQTFTVPEGYASTIDGDKLSLAKEDLVIEVTTECTHADSTYTADENAHRKVCNMGCGYDLVVPCSAQTYTVDAITEDELAAGEKATHSGTCEFCGEQFTLECEVDYVLSAKTSEESYWDYSKCVCGRENVEHNGTAIVRCGDANGDDAIDLLDAVKILRKSVRPEMEIKDRNADVDGDDIIQPKDALLAIRIWLGNNEAINVAKAAEDRFNGNLYNPDAVVLNQRLKMNGEAYAAEGYLLTELIAIKEGEKIAFGPVRLGATVMGYFLDEENKPLELVNYENATTEFTFEEGMAMVSITAPAGAKSIQLQLNEQEKDQFYVRIGAEVTLMGYQKQMLEDTKTIVNPLKNMSVLTVGDSLCAAANDTYNEGLKGWAARIRDHFGANVTNSAEGGASFSTAAYNVDINAELKNYTNSNKGGIPSFGQYIINQMLKHNGTKNFDYILLEGGVNDYYRKAPTGTFVPDSYDPADFDAETTMAGGLERLIYNAIKEHGDTASLGYMTIYAPTADSFKDCKDHLDKAKEICEKWGIAYLDLYAILTPDVFDATEGALTSDGCHATAEGYDIMQTHINDFIPDMRPISREIYEKVHTIGEIPAAKEDGGPLYTAEENPYKDSLKILAFGNSFSADATAYLWGIADSYGVEEVIVGNMMIGGCSLDTHYENMTTDAAAYAYYKWTTKDHVIRKDTSFSYALADEDWDIITIQQASGENLVFDNPDNMYDTTANPVDTYSKLDEILDYLNQNKPKEDTKILWHMTWAYASNSTHKAFAAYGNDQTVMYNSILDRAQELMGKYDNFAGVLPSGTAIQNLRKAGPSDIYWSEKLCDETNNKGVKYPVGSVYGFDTITRDGYHLNKGIGRYTAALTWYCYITGADPREVTYVPDNDYRPSIMLRRYDIGQSVLNAIQNPYNK